MFQGFQLPHRSVQSHGLFEQFFKYIVVGGLAFSVDFASLYLLTELLKQHYLLSASIGFLLGLLVNYCLCLLWIFDYRAIKNPWHEFVIFSAIGLAGLIINNALLYTLTEWAEIYYLASKMIAAILILLFNFILRRHILFMRR